MCMYRGLVASGAMFGIFGLFLLLLDLYVPLGVSVFGFPIAIAGAVMFVAGVLRGEPPQITPEPGKKFCWYCMAQISADETECSNCSLPQHDAAA
jgi:hypothetical protein